MKLTKAEAIVMLKELEAVVETAKDQIIAKNGGFVADGPRFAGPCGYSFCYGSCDMAACDYSYRLGKTPKEHNQELNLLVKQAGAEVQPMIKKLKALIKTK